MRTINNTFKKLGFWLGNARIHAALDQNEVASKAGISVVALSNIENHGSNMRLSTLLGLFKALSFSPTDVGAFMYSVMEEHLKETTEET